MDSHEAVAAAQREFERRLVTVSGEQWGWPTPCVEWTVYDLVNHVVAGSVAYTCMLDGCSTQETVDIFASNVIGDDPLGAFRLNAGAVSKAFRRPGALDRMCHHYLRDIPAAVLISIRMVDDLIHTWDLARATGQDERLDDDLVEDAWRFVLPLAPGLVATGDFVASSGEVDESFPLQVRLLDAVGRRP